MLHTYTLFNESLDKIEHSKVLISTLNAHSFNTVHKDAEFKAALKNSNVLLPDGIGVVWATKFLTGQRLKKIAGNDLFHYQMNRLDTYKGKCFFKSEFSVEDNNTMIEKINAVAPDVLFVGMTAPKQEKWAFHNFDKLNVGHICCIGAVFDFYAGTSKRAPKWMINIGLEWFYRLLSNPKRMWRRYLIGNALFIVTVLKEKFLLTTGLYKEKVDSI